MLFRFHGPDRVFWDPPRGILGRVKGSTWPARAGPNGALGGVKNNEISPTQKKEAPFARVFLASWNQRPKITKTTLNLQVAGAKPSSAKATCFYCKKWKTQPGLWHRRRRPARKRPFLSFSNAPTQKSSEMIRFGPILISFRTPAQKWFEIVRFGHILEGFRTPA